MDERLEAIEGRLTRIEDLLGRLVSAKAVKDFYTTAEVAELVDRSPFQVREWCQQGRIAAVKADSGHGRAKGWRIPHAALERYRSRGLLPCPDPTAARRSRP